jgi:hypothetical protein
MRHPTISLLRILLVTCVACCAFPLVAAAATPHPASKQKAAKVETTGQAEAKADAATKEGGPLLNQTILDRRYRFAKKFQSEFGIFGGDYLGDEWYNTWDVGARYYFHLNNDFAVGAEYFYSPIRADGTGNFGKSLTTKTTHTVTGAFIYSNDAGFRAGNSIVECDLMLTVGGGMMEINGQWKPTALIGGGIKIYTPLPWFAVRFDVNSYLHPTPKPGGNAFNADMAINLGFSFLAPIKKTEEHPTKYLVTPVETPVE